MQNTLKFCKLKKPGSFRWNFIQIVQFTTQMSKFYARIQTGRNLRGNNFEDGQLVVTNFPLNRNVYDHFVCNSKKRVFWIQTWSTFREHPFHLCFFAFVGNIKPSMFIGALGQKLVFEKFNFLSPFGITQLSVEKKHQMQMVVSEKKWGWLKRKVIENHIFLLLSAFEWTNASNLSRKNFVA